MLVVAGHVRMNPAKVAEATEAANAVMEATRKETGCLSYTFSRDLSEDGLFHIFEEWESQAALDAHFKAPHMATFQKAMGGFDVQEIKVNRYEVSQVDKLLG
jgi:quinol monooxygenase YgiN